MGIQHVGLFVVYAGAVLAVGYCVIEAIKSGYEKLLDVLLAERRPPTDEMWNLDEDVANISQLREEICQVISSGSELERLLSDASLDHRQINENGTLKDRVHQALVLAYRHGPEHLFRLLNSTRDAYPHAELRAIDKASADLETQSVIAQDKRA